VLHDEAGTSSCDDRVTGLKFFFEITLSRGEVLPKVQPVRVRQTLPVVLGQDEVARLLAAVTNLKHHTALSLAYGTGLRASEVIGLKVADVDSQRMTLRVEQGKGRKDRYAMLSPLLLERLRNWWRTAHAQGKILTNGRLFPGLDPMDPLTVRQLNRATCAAANMALIDKRVSMHILRHYSESTEMPSSVGKALAAGCMDGFLRALDSAYSGTSQGLEEGHQLIVGPEPGDSTLARFELVESRLLDVEIRIEIDLRCLDRLVAEPQRNHAALRARLQQLHGRRVAQHVRRHTLVAQGWAALASAIDVLGQQVLHAVCAEASPTRAGEDDRVIVGRDLAQPGTQDIGSGPGQRGGSLLAALAENPDMRAGAQANGAATQTGDLRQAQSCLNGQKHERVVAPPRQGAQIRDAQEGIDLRTREKPDLRPAAALAGNGQHSLNLGRMVWHLEGRVSKERTNGGQAQVAAAGTDASAAL
jgi:integrase/recombinase XerD